MTWSYAIWGGWFAAFVVLEFLGLFRVVPWVTLSETAWAVEGLSTWLKILFLAGLTVLTAHIVFHFPN